MSISCGENFTVFLKEDGTIECFGNNQLDQIYKYFTNIKIHCEEYIKKNDFYIKNFI